MTVEADNIEPAEVDIKKDKMSVLSVGGRSFGKSHFVRELLAAKLHMAGLAIAVTTCEPSEQTFFDKEQELYKLISLDEYLNHHRIHSPKKGTKRNGKQKRNPDRWK